MKTYICDISINSRPDAPTTQGLYSKPFILSTQSFIPLPSLPNPSLYDQTLRRLAPWCAGDRGTIPLAVLATISRAASLSVLIWRFFSCVAVTSLWSWRFFFLRSSRSFSSFSIRWARDFIIVCWLELMILFGYSLTLSWVIGVVCDSSMRRAHGSDIWSFLYSTR